MLGRLSWVMLFASACVGQGAPDDTDLETVDDTIDTRDTDLPDTDVADTDVADTDSGVLVDTDVADTDSGVLVDTDVADTDSGVLVDTDVADTDSGVLVDTDVADTDVLDTDQVDTDPPVVDADLDGFPAFVDCDDQDPRTNPGATQWCDGLDHTCGVAPVDPDGTVAVQHANGQWQDLTASFLSGTPTAPLNYTSAAGDLVRVCGGTWAATVDLSPNSSLIGVNQPTLAHSASRTGLSLAEGTRAEGIDLDVSATDVAALEAYGTASFTGGDIHGAKNGVSVIDVGHLTLEDVSVHDSAGSAIAVWQGAQASVTVVSSSISGAGEAAVQTFGDASATLKNVLITDSVKGFQGGAGDFSLTSVTLDAVDQPFDTSGSKTATLDDVHVSGATQISAWYAGELTVTASSFSDGRGWVVSPTDPATPILFDGCTFDRMDSGLSWGGALYVIGTHAAVTGSTFTNNRGSFGGAIFAFSHIVITDSTFTSNSGQSGGAIYLGDSGATPAEITDCTFKENSANWGGAVYTEAASTFLRDTFVGNTSVAGGGGIYMSASGPAPTTVTDSTFESNMAETGGGVCATRLTTSGNVWRGNTAANGGAIYAYTPRDNLNLRGDAFYANAAAQFGGAIAWGPTLSGQALVFGTGADANLPNEGASAGTNVKLVDGDVSCAFAVCVP